MDRKALAIVGAILGVVVVGGVTVSGISARSPEVKPSASAVARANPTPVATAEPAPSPSAAPATTVRVNPTAVPTATPSPTPPTVRLPKLTGKVKGATKVKYFRVTGASPNALIDSTVLKSKAGCESDDTLACVFLRPRVTWTERTRVATGACTIIGAQVNLTSTVHLPRWSSSKAVQPALLAWWQKMFSHMTWHEGQHIRIQKAADSKLVKSMNGHGCSSANKIYKKWQRSTDKAQDRFDAKDALWAYPEYIGAGG